MKKSILVLVLIFCLVSISNSGLGQLSMSYQYSSLNKIGIAYNFSQRFWTELRIYSNTSVSDFTPELTFLYNVSVKERHEIYIGAGVVINYFSGFVTPVGLQFRPFENFKRFSLQIEFEPTFDWVSEDLIFQSSAGIRYTFGKK
jgi:hypothetical protein